jgi:hypothetical protein
MSNLERSYSEKNVRKFRIPNDVSPTKEVVSPNKTQLPVSPQLLEAKKRITSTSSAQKLKVCR